MILLLTLLSLVFILHGLCNLYWLLYAWQDLEHLEKITSPTKYLNPQISFTALVPARHEAYVISETIRSINAIEYPDHLKEVLIICKSDDKETVKAAQKTIDELHSSRIRVVTFSGGPTNKPHGLNIGLLTASHDVIVIFDAEDQPHTHLYKIANTLMTEQHLDVLQSGVQLMNYRSHWFSTLNVLEYFFWFKSTLQFFAQRKTIPLGGNTVFFRRDVLLKANGWDETCLTEDADIGIRLSIAGAKIGVTYDEKYVTREETPSSINHFIKQRTRWNQGFLQILLKGEWLQLPTMSQRILSAYILLTPYMQSVFFLFIPFSLYLAVTAALPVWLVLILIVPFYLLVLQLIICNIGLYLFCRAYKKPYYIWLPLKVCVTFFPYQLLLGMSSTRALWRNVFGNTNWEKTLHLNAHREPQHATVDLTSFVEANV